MFTSTRICGVDFVCWSWVVGWADRPTKGSLRWRREFERELPNLRAAFERAIGEVAVNMPGASPERLYPGLLVSLVRSMDENVEAGWEALDAIDRTDPYDNFVVAWLRSFFGEFVDVLRGTGTVVLA